jgi:hypothetical protein
LIRGVVTVGILKLQELKNPKSLMRREKLETLGSTGAKSWPETALEG